MRRAKAREAKLVVIARNVDVISKPSTIQNRVEIRPITALLGTDLEIVFPIVHEIARQHNRIGTDRFDLWGNSVRLFDAFARDELR
jgi:hypothetical protein